MTDEAVLRELLDAFNAHDLDRIMSFFTEDCVLESPRGSDPWGTRYTGSQAVREGLAARFTGIPDVHYAEDEHWVCQGHAVSRWLLTGTSTSGEALRVRGCDLFGKDSYWKILT
jgi:ketosteroid isomerase-like protein